ncbi:hypothetical protein Tco_0077540 [Tanacetum coccineum]
MIAVSLPERLNVDKTESHHRFFPVVTSLIHIESHKSPTKSLFDVGLRVDFHRSLNTKEYHSDGSTLALTLEVLFLLFGSGGWSGLHQFQYLDLGMESDRNVVDLRENETEIFGEILSG